MKETIMNSNIDAQETRLANDMKALVRDVEELLRHAMGDAGQGYSEARERLEKTVQSARTELQAAAAAADRSVRRSPWQAVAVGAAAGMLVGLLIARR
jgi:ElaB/YqjD/DUF883 family membrane-anchored ribosome-binding protein